jgi:hypothetical protein
LWISFGKEILGRSPTQVEFSVTWMVFAGVLLGIASRLDRSRRSEESLKLKWESLSAHGPYVGGYALAIFALIWAIALWEFENLGAILWSLGLWIILMTASAALVHFKQHMTMQDMLGLIFGKTQNTLRQVVSDVFIWLASLSLPVWVAVFLWQLRVVTSFGYLGYGLTAIALLLLAVRLRRIQHTYAWPLMLSGQFFTLFALLQTSNLSIVILTRRSTFVGNQGLQAGSTRNTNGSPGFSHIQRPV